MTTEQPLIVPKTIDRAVVGAVCDPSCFELSPAVLKSKSRMAHVVRARQLAIFLMRATWGDAYWSGADARLWATYDQIGRNFNRDHTTVIYSMERVPELLRSDPYYKAQALAALGLLRSSVPALDQALLAHLTGRLEAL